MSSNCIATMRDINKWVNYSLNLPIKMVFILLIWIIYFIYLILNRYVDGEILCDDAFYYFEIVRNATMGRGFTFDNISPTNGFHPLWAVVLLPVFHFFKSYIWLPIHIALIISVLFTAITAIVIFKVFKLNNCGKIGEYCAYIWLLNPYTNVLMLRGLEGPLSTLLVSLCIYLPLKYYKENQITNLSCIVFGIIIGLCLLARTDNIFVLFVLVVCILCLRFSYKRYLFSIKKVLICGVTIFLVLSPWLIWNLVRFETIVQSSFIAKNTFKLHNTLNPIWNEKLHGVESALYVIEYSIRNLYHIALYNSKYLIGEESVPISNGYLVFYIFLFYFVLLTIAPIIIKNYYSREKSKGIINLNHISIPSAIYCVIHFIWYGWIQKNYYNWYFLPPVLFFTLFQGVQLLKIFQLKNSVIRITLLIIFMGYFILSGIALDCHIFKFGKKDGLEAGYLKNVAPNLRILPKNSKVGLWNAGIVGYFSSFYFQTISVINLDGVVNNEILHFETEKKYEKYLINYIDFIVENPEYLTRIIGNERAIKFITNNLEFSTSFWKIKK